MKYLLNKKNYFGIFVVGVVLFVAGCARDEHNKNTYNISYQKTYSQELADSVYSQLPNFVTEIDKLLEKFNQA